MYVNAPKHYVAACFDSNVACACPVGGGFVFHDIHTVHVDRLCAVVEDLDELVVAVKLVETEHAVVDLDCADGVAQRC